uniref:Integrase, catalytic region, zinc finger, CCHC-type, peptidase aspartic, catalytic n=1 Tax=Tanacetum cinerariifolium TaxID=118510 RepID=A0A6L2MCQ6_TANCI|nr:hypothetical protein [Tanacetum cinerariifolium]
MGGVGIQATLAVEDSYVTLTPVHPDGQQESSSVSSQFVTSMLNSTLDVGMESIFETTSQLDVPTPTSIAPLPITTPTMTSSTIATTTTTTSQAPILLTVLSNITQHLPSFGSLFCFDDRLRSLEENFSEFRQTNQFAGAVSSIPEIINHYMDQRMNKAVKVAVQIQSDWLCDETQRENDEFLRTAVNEQLKAEVLTQSSHSSRTSYAVAADLTEMKLKMILIEKMQGNKSIQCSDEQRNLFKALVDAYESDKIILDTYGETVTLKRRRDNDADKDEEPSAGPDQGSKRRREGKEPESARATMETATRSAGRSTQWSRSRQASVREFALAEEPMQTTSQMEEPSHSEFDTGADDQLIVQSSQRPEWFPPQQKPLTLDRDWNKTLPIVYGSIQPVNTLTPELLAGPTYELMKGSLRRDDDKLYKFKEGDFKRLCIQDIEDMLLLLVQGKLTNLTVREHFAFNVSLRMFTRSIVIQRRVEETGCRKLPEEAQPN